MASFSIREEPDALVVTIDEPGALNDFRSNSFRESLYETVVGDHRKGVALSLKQVDFLSSSGLAILVGLKKRVEGRQGKLVIFSVHPVVSDLLRITRLTQFFHFADNESDALSSLRPLPTA